MATLDRQEIARAIAEFLEKKGYDCDVNEITLTVWTVKPLDEKGRYPVTAEVEVIRKDGRPYR